MHIGPILTARPSDQDIDLAAHRLLDIIEDALDALLLLQPDIDRLPPPASALRGAVHADPAFTRAERRVRDVLLRLQEQVPEALHEDLDELEGLVTNGMHEACQVGWSVGIRVGRRPRADDASIDALDAALLADEALLTARQRFNTTLQRVRDLIGADHVAMVLAVEEAANEVVVRSCDVAVRVGDGRGA